MSAQNIGIRREGHRFPESQNHADDNQGSESVQNSSNGCRCRPKKKTRPKDPLHIEAIDQPTSRNLHQRISPEKCRKQSPQLRGGKMQFVCKKRRGNREITAIDVVDKNRKPKQE